MKLAQHSALVALALGLLGCGSTVSSPEVTESKRSQASQEAQDLTGIYSAYRGGQWNRMMQYIVLVTQGDDESLKRIAGELAHGGWSAARETLSADDVHSLRQDLIKRGVKPDPYPDKRTLIKLGHNEVEKYANQFGDRLNNLANHFIGFPQ